MGGEVGGVADFGAFVVAVIVFLAIPGPGNLALNWRCRAERP